jgi:antitoxin (DNA-binding transcriptional repressor) of toxin-antitoxin stability system
VKHDSISPDEKAAALLRVASYLGRPQQFMAIADARAEMRRTLELAAKGSVVLTTHGEPAAAVVPFTTLEDMRRALLHLLVAEIEATFTRSQERLKSRSGEVPLSSEEEMEGLVGEALRGARRPRRRSGRKVSRG